MPFFLHFLASKKGASAKASFDPAWGAFIDTVPAMTWVADNEGRVLYANAAWREALAWPPFSRLVAVRIEGEDPGQTASVARKLGDRLTVLLPGPAAGVRLLGPAPAPLARL